MQCYSFPQAKNLHICDYLLTNLSMISTKIQQNNLVAMDKRMYQKGLFASRKKISYQKECAKLVIHKQITT